MRVLVRSAGAVEGAEVVHLFVAPSPALLAATPQGALPLKALKGFARVTIKPGEYQAVQLPLSSKDFQYAALGEGSRLHSFVPVHMQHVAPAPVILP